MPSWYSSTSTISPSPWYDDNSSYLPSFEAVHMPATITLWSCLSYDAASCDCFGCILMLLQPPNTQSNVTKHQSPWILSQYFYMLRYLYELCCHSCVRDQSFRVFCYYAPCLSYHKKNWIRVSSVSRSRFSLLRMKVWSIEVEPCLLGLS